MYDPKYSIDWFIYLKKQTKPLCEGGLLQSLHLGVKNWGTESLVTCPRPLRPFVLGWAMVPFFLGLSLCYWKSHVPRNPSILVTLVWPQSLCLLITIKFLLEERGDGVAPCMRFNLQIPIFIQSARCQGNRERKVGPFPQSGGIRNGHKERATTQEKPVVLSLQWLKNFHVLCQLLLRVALWDRN